MIGRYLPVWLLALFAVNAAMHKPNDSYIQAEKSAIFSRYHDQLIYSRADELEHSRAYLKQTAAINLSYNALHMHR